MAEPAAAVAIVHAHSAEESVLLIRRTERDDDPWSGHWSFPGGRRDPGDIDLVQTALRELAEECGIELSRDSLEASLPPTLAGRRVGHTITVAPFLFRAERELPTVLDPREAAEALWIPLSVIRDPMRHCLTPVPRMPPEQSFPAIQLNGVPLWGFTYRVITEWLGVTPQQPD
jgi:8-oxo-dGTP pyrophosphatase MutT (NUDIX family)